MTLDDRLRSSAAHVIVDSLEAPVLDADDEHHLRRVLRLRDGEVVTATDGRGRWVLCRWRGELEVDGPVTVVEQPAPSVAVGFTPTKRERPEWVVQKLTELGVDRIIVLRAARSVVTWDESRLPRLANAARQACMQARRCVLPLIEGVAAVADVQGALAHFDGEPVSLDQPVVLIGPEGGWDDAELALPRPHVRLGDFVQRAETAALTAGSLLTALRSCR